MTGRSRISSAGVAGREGGRVGRECDESIVLRGREGGTGRTFNHPQNLGKIRVFLQQPLLHFHGIGVTTDKGCAFLDDGPVGVFFPAGLPMDQLAEKGEGGREGGREGGCE